MISSDESNFVIAQVKSRPEYLDFYTDMMFTEEDNKLLAQLPGGTAETIRSLRVHLALLRVGHSVIEAPLAKIQLFKRVLITSDFSEQKFIDYFYQIEAAFNIVNSIVAQPDRLVRNTQPLTVEPQPKALPARMSPPGFKP